jgi:hypothetical protein
MQLYSWKSFDSLVLFCCHRRSENSRIGDVNAKRDISASVKMSEQDWKLLAEAGALLWPGMPVSRSTLILSLAKRAAEDALQKNKPPRKH